MMTLKLQTIIGIALIIALAVIITMIRKRQLELKYSLSWIIAIIFVLVLDCFPILLNKLSFFLSNLLLSIIRASLFLLILYT